MVEKCMRLEEKLQNKLFSRRDFTLISTMLKGSLSKEEAICLTENMDIDTESSLYMLSMSIVGFRSGWEQFPDWVVPRVKGLHRYYQVSSGAGVPWLKARLVMLSEAGIPYILTGGTAMRAFYASDVPRLNYGYDITVHTKDYEKAVILLRDGIKKSSSDPSDRTVNGYTKIMMHKGVPDAGLFSEDLFWERACTVGFLEQNVLVPCPEDMLLQLLCIPFGAQLIRELNDERNRRLYEAGFVLKKGPVDYKLLADKARACGLESQARFFLSILNKNASRAFPKDEWASFFCSDKDYISFLKNMLHLEEILNICSRKPKSSYLQSLRQIRAEQKVVFPVRKARRMKTGLLAYTIETRNIRHFSDVFRKKRAERMKNYE